MLNERKERYPARIPKRSRSPLAQETFINSQNDKHSDLITHLSEDTVMAVAADSHRSFLIPEQRHPFKAPKSSAQCARQRILIAKFR